MRHESPADRQDDRAESMFAQTTTLNGAGVDAELARPQGGVPVDGNNRILRPINACLDHPEVGCPHVDRSMCALAMGRATPKEDPCPWVTFTYHDEGKPGVLVHLDKHHDSRAAQRAAVDRNCHWGRVIRMMENGDYIVERMGGPRP